MNTKINRNMHSMMSRSNVMRPERMITTRYSSMPAVETDNKYDDSKDRISLKEEIKDDGYDSKSYSRMDYKDSHMYSDRVLFYTLIIIENKSKEKI